MKNATAVTRALMLIAVLAMVFVTTANAQTSGRFDIPFQFVAGQTILPAGEYRVNAGAGSPWMRIVETSGAATVNLLVIPKYAQAAQATGRMEFRRIGDTYVLTGVWLRGNDRGLQMPSRQVERELARASEEITSVAQVNEATPLRGQ